MKFNMLLNFLGLLRKSHKLFFRNGKAVSSITLLIILVRSFLLVINLYTLKPIITGFAIKARFLATTSPRGAEFADLVTAAKYEYVRIISWTRMDFHFGVVFYLIVFCNSLSLSISSIILWKRLVHQGTSTKGTEVIEKTICTWFYITLLDLGYFSFLFASVLPLVLIFNLQLTISAFAVVACILALVVQTYLAVVWNLALVVSVLEEKCGMEALGKAGQLIKGSKLRGFFLNVVIATSLWLLFVLYRIVAKAIPVKAVIIPLLLLNCISCLIAMVPRMAYTVLYYESKATPGHDEELERTARKLGHAKVTSDTPLINADAI